MKRKIGVIIYVISVTIVLFSTVQFPVEVKFPLAILASGFMTLFILDIFETKKWWGKVLLFVFSVGEHLVFISIVVGFSWGALQVAIVATLVYVTLRWIKKT